MAKKNKVEEPRVEEPKVEEPKVETKKVFDEFFAGKKVLDKYKKDGGEFIVLEGGETIKV